MGFTAAVAYYSVMFGQTYRDGYGYNFYYGNYGYYEYSEHPPAPTDESTIATVLALACICFCLCGCLMVYRDEEDRDEDSMPVEIVEENVVEEKRQQVLNIAHNDNSAPVFNQMAGPPGFQSYPPPQYPPGFEEPDYQTSANASGLNLISQPNEYQYPVAGAPVYGQAQYAQ